MKKGLYGIWLAGFALLLALIARQGFSEVSSALAVAGFGMVWVTVYHLVPMFADTLAWRCLLPRRHHVPFSALLRMRWLAESVNTLLPVAQVGGEFLKTRLLMLRGIPGSLAGASAVGDLTTTVIAQVVFCTMGVLLLGQLSNSGVAVWEFLMGLGALALLILGFYFAQRAGLFFYLARLLERIGGQREWLSLSGSAAALDQAVNTLYRRQKAFWAACFLHLMGWIAGAGEVWLALYFLGYPVTVVQAFVLESLITAVRSAAFAIPGALGVQEGGLMVIAPLVGLSPETGLSLSLAKRVRELILGLPGLIAWHVSEARHFVGRGVSRRA
jgi:putative membrane protein